jgi:hypothetical protein
VAGDRLEHLLVQHPAEFCVVFALQRDHRLKRFQLTSDGFLGRSRSGPSQYRLAR